MINKCKSENRNYIFSQEVLWLILYNIIVTAFSEFPDDEVIVQGSNIALFSDPSQPTALHCVASTFSFAISWNSHQATYSVQTPKWNAGGLGC